MYDEYVNGNYNSRTKYDCYLRIQYLMTLSDKQFIEQFNVKNDDDIE